jgi:hypothetical protein
VHQHEEGQVCAPSICTLSFSSPPPQSHHSLSRTALSHLTRSFWQRFGNKKPCKVYRQEKARLWGRHYLAGDKVRQTPPPAACSQDTPLHLERTLICHSVGFQRKVGT